MTTTPKTKSQGPLCTELAGTPGAPEEARGVRGAVAGAGGADIAGPYPPPPWSAGMRGCWSGCDSPGVDNSGGNSDAGPNVGTAGIDAAGSSRGNAGCMVGIGICLGTSRTLTRNGGFLPSSASIRIHWLR